MLKILRGARDSAIIVNSLGKQLYARLYRSKKYTPIIRKERMLFLRDSTNKTTKYLPVLLAGLLL